VDPAKVPAAGVRARCSVCGAVIRIGAPAPMAGEPVGAGVTGAESAGWVPNQRAVLESEAEAAPESFEGAPPAAPEMSAMPAPVATPATPARPVTPAVAAPAVAPARPVTPLATPAAAAPAAPVMAPRAPTPPAMPPKAPLPPTPAPRASVAKLTPPIPGAAIPSTPPRPPVPGVPPVTPPRITQARPPLATPPRPSMMPPARPPAPPSVPPKPPMPPMPPARPSTPVARPSTPVARPSLSSSTPTPLSTPKLTPSPLSTQRVSQPMRPSAATPVSAPGATPAAGTPGRKPINPFLSNDPNLKARRLARALVSDMIAYLPDKREQGLREGTLKALFKEEIKKSYEEYVDQVGREFADSTTHFQEALNDLLAGGQKMF